jgi:hypothetical protein
MMAASSFVGGALVGDAGVGGVFAEGCCQGVEVVSLVAEDLTEVFAEGELVELFGLADAATIVADRLLFVVEVEAEHLISLFAGLDFLRGDGRHAAEVVDPEAELEGVRELFMSVLFELAGDVHIGCAFEHLRVVHVADDGLELALQILVEEVDELLFREGAGGGCFAGLVYCHDRDVSLSRLTTAR